MFFNQQHLLVKAPSLNVIWSLVCLTVEQGHAAL